MRRTAKSQDLRLALAGTRFVEDGFDGLVRDKRVLADQAAQRRGGGRVVTLTLGDPPGETTHWTGALMARAAEPAVSSVQRIWRAHEVPQPHRMRQFKLSNDLSTLRRQIARRRRALCRSARTPSSCRSTKKSQVQALDRTQPGLPLKKGRAGTMTHDYGSHGTTTLFAAMNVLDGTMIGRNMQRHRHQEFIRFLNVIEKQVPAGKTIHAIVDNYAAHKHPNVRDGSNAIRDGRSISPRHRPLGSTPSRLSQPSQSEGSRRSVFRSVADLQAAINRFLEEHNQLSDLHLDRRSRQNHRRSQARAPVLNSIH